MVLISLSYIISLGSNLLQFITFRDGRRLSIINEGGIPYLLNAELSDILPQANQNVIGPLRSLLNIPLEYASRYIVVVLTYCDESF